jgi:hypothetical protein
VRGLSEGGEGGPTASSLAGPHRENFPNWFFGNTPARSRSGLAGKQRSRWVAGVGLLSRLALDRRFFAPVGCVSIIRPGYTKPDIRSCRHVAWQTIRQVSATDLSGTMRRRGESPHVHETGVFSAHEQPQRSATQIPASSGLSNPASAEDHSPAPPPHTTGTADAALPVFPLRTSRSKSVQLRQAAGGVSARALRKTRSIPTGRPVTAGATPAGLPIPVDCGPHTEALPDQEYAGAMISGVPERPDVSWHCADIV